jgi:hypothetical protein
MIDNHESDRTHLLSRWHRFAGERALNAAPKREAHGFSGIPAAT